MTKQIDFTHAIQLLLKKSKVSASELSRRINKSRSYMAQMENKNDLGINAIHEICHVLGFTLADFMKLVDDSFYSPSLDKSILTKIILSLEAMWDEDKAYPSPEEKAECVCYIYEKTLFLKKEIPELNILKDNIIRDILYSQSTKDYK